MTEHGNFDALRALWTLPLFREKCFTANPQCFTKVEAFLWLVSHAASETQVSRIGRKAFEIQRGQLAVSTRELATHFAWSQGRTRRFLKALKINSLIDSLPRTQTTIVIVRNYDLFENMDSLCDSLLRSASEAQVTHLNGRNRLTSIARKFGLKSLKRVA